MASLLRQKLTHAAITCSKQEEYANSMWYMFKQEIEESHEIPVEWITVFNNTYYRAICILQQNAIVLDSMLEDADNKISVDLSLIPETPIEYFRMKTFIHNKDRLSNPYSRLIGAIVRKDIDFIDLLLQVVDPSSEDNCPILLAAEQGDLAVVNRLLQDPRVDPDAQERRAVRAALRCKHDKIVERFSSIRMSRLTK